MSNASWCGGGTQRETIVGVGAGGENPRQARPFCAQPGQSCSTGRGSRGWKRSGRPLARSAPDGRGVCHGASRVETVPIRSTCVCWGGVRARQSCQDRVAHRRFGWRQVRSVTGRRPQDEMLCPPWRWPGRCEPAARLVGIARTLIAGLAPRGHVRPQCRDTRSPLHGVTARGKEFRGPGTATPIHREASQDIPWPGETGNNLRCLGAAMSLWANFFESSQLVLARAPVPPDPPASDCVQSEVRGLEQHPLFSRWKSSCNPLLLACLMS